jgi:hypothetical protein
MTGGRYVRPGPHCKPTKIYHALPKGYGIGCATCKVYSEENFRVKTEASRWFRLHKADGVITWPKVFQQAIDNLKAGGLW